MSPRSFAGRCLFGGTVLAAFGAACGDPPTTPSPPGPSVVRIEIVGPDAIAPGQSAQYSAVRVLADGSRQPATEVIWTSSQPTLFQVSTAGLVTTQPPLRGEATLQAETTTGTSGARRASKEILVLPDGTFRLVGTVTEADATSILIGGVRLEAAVDPDFPTLATFATSGPDGRYKLYGVPGDAYLRVRKDGYFTTTDRIQLATHGTRNYQLRLDGERPSLAGNYTITIDATSSSCGSQPLPNALRRRTYDAVIAQNGPELVVTLTAPQFVVVSNGQGNRFTGVVTATGAAFRLRDFFDFYYYPTGPQHPDVAELVADGTVLVVSGGSTVTGTSAGLSGPLSGWLSQYRGSNFPSVIYLSSCYGARLTVTPR